MSNQRVLVEIEVLREEEELTPEYIEMKLNSGLYLENFKILSIKNVEPKEPLLSASIYKLRVNEYLVDVFQHTPKGEEPIAQLICHDKKEAEDFAEEWMKFKEAQCCFCEYPNLEDGTLTYETDPFDSVVYGDNTPCWMCSDCKKERTREAIFDGGENLE